MSYYPPGVTGGEFEIAGPDEETDAERFCPHCKHVTTGYDVEYGNEMWYACEECGHNADLEDCEDERGEK